jgi:GT2 family glycosyltransferase
VSDANEPDAAGPCPADFDEVVYLELNPDVAAEVAKGGLASGRAHYLLYGARESRRYLPVAGEVREAVVIAMAATRADGSRAPSPPPFGIEAVRMSPGGGVFVAGWIDDATDPLEEFLLEGDGWRFDLLRVSLARTRRRDVEQKLGSTERHPYGFWSFVDLGHEVARHAACRLVLRLASGAGITLQTGVSSVPDADLRDAALAWLAGADHFGDKYAAAVASLDGGAGAQLVANNRRLTEAIVANPFVERFGPAGGKPRGSLVVCLYGRPEFLFIQNALFAGLPGIEDYEFVYVCNSPDLADRLLPDARIASLVHGTRQTLVLLPGNAGFGAANNVGVAHAKSDRVVALNPDVVPRQPDWARRHTEVVASLPAAQTDVFGVPLYYEDGSLMHGGMYFEVDSVPVEGRRRLLRRDLVRVEHYGKGAPPDAEEFIRSRRVPAVTGAFQSFRRGWFERLGGFSDSFMFGHYEDADLCLRSLMAGTPAWLHDIRLWHLEGKGGVRSPAAEGASFVNRWQFSRAWAGTIRHGLLGPAPTHRLLTTTPAPPPTPVKKRKAAS